METCLSGPKVAVLHPESTDEGCKQYSIFILLCVLKTTDEVFDPYRLVILVEKALFCLQKQ